MDRAGLWVLSSPRVLPTFPWVRGENGSMRDEAKRPLSPAVAGLAGERGKEASGRDRVVSQRSEQRNPQCHH